MHIDVAPGGHYLVSDEGHDFVLSREQALAVLRLACHQAGVLGYEVNGSGRLADIPIGQAEGERLGNMERLHDLCLVITLSNHPLGCRLTRDGRYVAAALFGRVELREELGFDSGFGPRSWYYAAATLRLGTKESAERGQYFLRPATTEASQ